MISLKLSLSKLFHCQIWVICSFNFNHDFKK